ncbi:GHKL domain-containing protein [Anaerocolumna sedimenticola]|uniref:GHKL domain-containing protein n=1 Tax=Anaerocolumna sedimenticola TaxID=2696063 RepID=A0A6P1TLT3_9FIRM|nr:GHKL domain-containing protein [Anaerocolumna sedimenticola]QHQ60258.1 GHKL domain-containing protein [Anaerocolumna sedimenticola]
MIWTVIEYSATLIQCFVSTEFVTRYLGFKNDSYKKYIGFITAFIAQVTATLIMNKITIFEGVAGLIYPGIVVIYGIFFLNGSIFEKIIIACIDNGLKMITGISVLTLISYISPYEVTNLITQQGIERFIVLAMAQSSYFFLTRMILRLQRNNKFALSIMEWIAILSVFITSFAAGVLVFEILITSPNTRQNGFFAVLIMISLILINVLCYYIFVNISAKNKERLQYSLMELRLKEQEKNLVEMKQSYEEIRKIRHDMKNYVECAATLLHNGKDTEAKTYLSTLLENKITFGTQLVLTISDAINAVISSKASLCQRHNIIFHYEITGSVEKIPELDLSILLANLFDNAIEASNRIKNNREINLKIYNERNYLVILINNYIAESVLDKNPHLRTTKKDKLQHGVGSLSIKDIVNKHNGMISFYEKNGIFMLTSG